MVVEGDDSLGRTSQVGDDEADARVQLARMPSTAPLSSLLDFAWRIAFRLGFPLARIWWGLTRPGVRASQWQSMSAPHSC